MTTYLEFLNEYGSEGIDATHLHESHWQNYEGPIFNTGDELIADFGKRFKVVKRVLYLLPAALPTIKVSLHCQELPWKD